MLEVGKKIRGTVAFLRSLKDDHSPERGRISATEQGNEGARFLSS